MVNNIDGNKIRKKKVSSDNRIKRPNNSRDEERLRENTKSKPIFEKKSNNDFKRNFNNKEKSELINKKYTNKHKNSIKDEDYSILPSERKKQQRQSISNNRNRNSLSTSNKNIKFESDIRKSRDKEIIKKSRDRNKKRRKEWKDRAFSYTKNIIAIILILCTIVGISGFGYAKYVTKDMPEVTKKMIHEKYVTSKEVPIKDMPKDLRNAIVSIEDERFYTHNGVDKKALIRSAIHNLLSDSRQGGSTIEMQLSKNILTNSEVSMKRKIKDMYNAIGMNKVMKKEEILEAYLNNIYLGRNAYGVAKGSELYFGKNVKDLNLAESAMLVGITNNPKIYGNYSAAKSRQKVILKKMYDLGYIKEFQYREALVEMVHFRSEIE